MTSRNYGKPSPVRYMTEQPKHFGTNIANPMTRYGDAPYVRCPECRLLYTQTGYRAHLRMTHKIIEIAPRKVR